MAQPLTLPEKIQLRCDPEFLALIASVLEPGEDRSKFVRNAALAEAKRRLQGEEKR